MSRFAGFSALGISPSDFNTVVRPLNDLNHKKSDSNNGYYIVSDVWGSCFFRVASKITDKIEVRSNNNPNCYRTYTRIPASLMHNVFFVYVNYTQDQSFRLHLPPGARIIGMHDSQPHKVGRWMSQSCLVYSPSGESPTIEQQYFYIDPQEIEYMNHKEEVHRMNVKKLMHGRYTQRFFVRPDGYIQSKSNDERNTLAFSNSSGSSGKATIGDLITLARASR